MAKYRQFHVRFWKDPDIEQLEPIDKLIFAYLFTNEGCTESGIYPITLKTISNETCIPIDQVKKRFESGVKNILYDWDNNIVFVVKFLEHNGGGRPDLLLAAIRKECKTTPTKLWDEFIQIYPQYTEDLTEIIKQFPNGLPTVYKPFNRNRNRNRNSNSKKKQPKKKTTIKPYIDKVNEYFKSEDIEFCRPYWAAAYPNVDIDAELVKAKAWLVSNTSKAKSDFRKFCNNWLKSEMDRISKRAGSSTPAPSPAKVMDNIKEVYAAIVRDCKEKQQKDKKYTWTDAAIIAHMKNTLGYDNSLLIQLIDELGGPEKLTGEFPTYNKVKNKVNTRL